MKLSELQRKDIINLTDGKVIGRIIDVEIEEGLIKSFIVEKSKYFRNIFSADSDIEIKYSQIKKLGSDVILIDIN